MTKHPLYGLGTALITPFKDDKSVDFEALARLLDTQLTGNIDYLVVLGTTGESVTLTAEEKREVRQFIVAYTKQWAATHNTNPIPLVLGVGGNNTAQVISDLNAIKHESILDFTAILSVCPYYNKPNQEGLFQHFSAIAEVSPIPIILYNVPGRTGVNLLPETVMRIYNAHTNKIIGIKEASGNLDQIKQLIAMSKEQKGKNNTPLLIISGDDGIACEVMKAGGAGLISVASNAFPDDFRRIVHEQDEALQAQYDEMVKLLFAEGNPVGIKAVLTQKEIIQNYLRLPLVPASKELTNNIAALL
jgi:4-hydroxy-tetrahydrodipicolinate synthase